MKLPGQFLAQALRMVAPQITHTTIETADQTQIFRQLGWRFCLCCQRGNSCLHSVAEFRQTSREVIQQVIRANAARERLPALLQLRDDLEAVLVLVLLRLVKEVKEVKEAKEVKAFNIMHAPRSSALRWPIGSGFCPPIAPRSGRHCGLLAVPATSVFRRPVFQA